MKSSTSFCKFNLKNSKVKSSLSIISLLKNLPKYFWLALAGVLKAGVEASAVVSFSTKTSSSSTVFTLNKNFSPTSTIALIPLEKQPSDHFLPIQYCNLDTFNIDAAFLNIEKII